MKRKRVIIVGAAGRDFHNFNVAYRDDPSVEVVAFTATQIPGIAQRRYPTELAGPLYPDGIEIVPESELERVIARTHADEVVFAYSDVAHADVMHVASRALAAGADFSLLGPRRTMLSSSRPVVAVCAVRTGCGKSPLSRVIARTLREQGRRVVAVRHPMPYGELARQAVQRFERIEDLAAAHCTIEEMEEYEPHLRNGIVVFAGADYEAILRRAESEADVIVWDGGNNDFSFFETTLEFVVVDPHRPGHESSYHPGEANALRAHVIAINKVDTASPDGLARVRANVAAMNPRATVIETAMPVRLDDPAAVRDRRVLVIDDGPTLTHGGMSFGAGVIAARAAGAREIVDPRPAARGTIRDTFERFPHLSHSLPAMGYSDAQIAELEATIRGTDCDVVLVATPIDLRRVLKIEKPTVRASYDVEQVAGPSIASLLAPIGAARRS